MGGRGRVRDRRLKARSQILFPYKEELSFGKMQLAAVGDNDYHLPGDFRDTMEGLITREALGLVAFMVFCPFKIPEPMAFSGQEDERHTYIRECKAPLWIWKLVSKCYFAKWRANRTSSFLVFIPIPIVCLLFGFQSFQAILWAAIFHGMSFSSADMLLLEYWKGL